MKKTKGITLIALIITIIVLLILAGVALATLTGQGNIIGNAENAVGQYNNSVAEEQQLLNEIMDYIKNDGNGDIEDSGISLSVVADTTGISKKVIVTIVGQAENGIKSLACSNGVNKTYEEGTKEIQETIEITANGIYTFTIEDIKGKTASKGILIENILEGTIQIKADKTMPTKDNVKVTVTWPSGSEKGIKEIKVGNNSWEVASGNTSEVDVTQNCTVVARVSNSTGEVTQASITISNIDKANPIVTVVTEGEETIEEGTSKEISSYFTYSANGVAEIINVKYTDTSNGDAVVANTNTLTEGTHIIKCTVTKETGAVGMATKTIIVEVNEPEIVGPGEIASKPEEHYGGEVTNYTTPSGDPNVKWRIFYADESNIYLIASDYIHYDYVPTSANYTLYDNGNGYKLSFNNVYKDYTGASNITDPRITKWLSYISDNQNAIGKGIQAVAFMLDISRWNEKYRNETYADYAIGGPTLDLFCESYENTHKSKYIEYIHNTTGYQMKWSNSTDSYGNSLSILDTSDNLYVITSPNKCSTTWIAAPSSVYVDSLLYVSSAGMLSSYGAYTNPSTGFRPVVCLKSGVQLEKISDTEYRILE